MLAVEHIQHVYLLRTLMPEIFALSWGRKRIAVLVSEETK